MPIDADVIDTHLSSTQLAMVLEKILVSAREELRQKMKPEAKKKVDLNELFAPVIAQIKTLSLNLNNNDPYTQAIATVNEAKEFLSADWIKETAVESIKSFNEFLKDVYAQATNDMVKLEKSKTSDFVTKEDKVRIKNQIKQLSSFRDTIKKKAVNPPDPVLIGGLSILGVAVLGLIIKSAIGGKKK